MVILHPVGHQGASGGWVVIIATDVGEGMRTVCKLDGWIVADVQMVHGRQRGADYADVEAVVGDDEFAEAREGYWQDEVDVVIVRDEILNG